MDYQAAKTIADQLHATVKATGKALGSIEGVGTGSMGLTPDSVKRSEEYKAARAAYDLAHHRARTFNATYVRTFKNEIRADRRARLA